MLKQYKATYEIWDVDTEEVLVDNLSFEEAAVQSAVYQEFYGDGVFVAVRESRRTVSHNTYADEFKTAWISYFEELQAMGNLH